MQKATAKKPDYKLNENIRNYFFSKPTVSYSAADIAGRFGLKKAAATYHIQTLRKKGAIEAGAAFAQYRASATFKTPAQIRDEVAKAQAVGAATQIVQGAEWRHGAQPNAITGASNYTYLRRHMMATRARIVEAGCLIAADLEALDEVIEMALGPTPKKPPLPASMSNGHVRV